MTRVDYYAVNSRGTILRTFDTLETARKWVKAHHVEHVGLVVEEVTVTTSRRRVYRPNAPSLRVVA
ncbi:MAG: hypothetical protein WCO83_02345 [Alphaproteobacteria bacterium]